MNLYTVALIIFVSIFLLRAGVCSDISGTDYILCRHCGSDIADLSYLENRFSPESLISINKTIFNVTNVGVQLLRNPLGIEFEIVTFSKAGCVGYRDWQTQHSWFPGYAWKHCVCQHCGRHLGWVFEPIASSEEPRRAASDRGFYALILDNILSESFSNSLLAPSYRY